MRCAARRRQMMCKADPCWEDTGEPQQAAFADSRLPITRFNVGIVTMHIFWQPPRPDKNRGNIWADPAILLFLRLKFFPALHEEVTVYIWTTIHFPRQKKMEGKQPNWMRASSLKGKLMQGASLVEISVILGGTELRARWTRELLACLCERERERVCERLFLSWHMWEMYAWKRVRRCSVELALTRRNSRASHSWVLLCLPLWKVNRCMALLGSKSQWFSAEQN